MTKIIDQHGHEIDFDAAVNLMDNEIREDLHDQADTTTDQAFFDAYCARHEAKFGTPFVVN